jgi:plastocyanin
VVISIRTQSRPDGSSVAEFPPNPAVISVGGDVQWNNRTSVPVDVTFDDSAHVFQDDSRCAAVQYFPLDWQPYLIESWCGGGNIPTWSREPVHGFDARVRQFRAPGTYHYHSVLNGTVGTIIVQ